MIGVTIWMTSDASVGWFAAAARLSTAVLLVPVVMTSALLPVLTRLGRSQPATSADALRRSLQVVLLLTMPMAAGLSAIAEPLFAFLHYPAAFSRSIPILVVLSASWVVTAAVMVLACAVVAQGRQRAWAIASVAMIGWFALLNLVLIPLAVRAWANGGIGAAIANFAGELAFGVVALVIVREPVLRKRDVAYYGRVAIATAAMVVIVRVAPLSLPLLIALGGLAYAGFSLLLRTLTVGDMRLALQLVRRDSSPFPTPLAASEPIAS